MQKEARKNSGLLERILWIITIAISVMLLISLISPLFNPHKLWVPAFFGLAYPYIAFLTLALAIVMCFFRFRKAILPIFIFLIGIGPCRHTIKITSTSNSFSEQERDLKILSQNVHLLGAYDTSGISTRDSVLNVIHSEAPDIACFQEFYNRDNLSKESVQDFIETGMFSNFVSTTYTTDGSDSDLLMVIFTKFSIIGQGVVKDPTVKGRDIFAIWCDMIVKGDTIRVYNAHLQSIGFTSEEESLFAGKDKSNQEIKYKSKSTARKLKRAFVVRSVQVDLLASHIDSCKYPVFLCGDFNDTPVSYAYRSLRGNLNDAFLECGPRGMGKTYNGPFPSFRIDYILFPDGYDAAGFKVLGRSYSDHFPVSCRFKKEE